MPLPNFHACRLLDPDLFKTCRTTTRKSDGKEYSILTCQYKKRPKGKSDWAEQGYRYDRTVWTVQQAKNHCDLKKGDFEPAEIEMVHMIERGNPLKDFEYLLHHIEIDDQGKEQIHHCYLYDHIANLFEQTHLLVKDGRTYLDGKEITDGLFHIIKGLESTQEVAWSDDEAVEGKIRPKKMGMGMTLKQKAREW